MINKDFLKTESEKMGIMLDSESLMRFDLFAQRLLAWNSRVNLTAITDPQEIAIKHFLDSISPLSYISPDNGAKIIDVGCGAGFPGFPLLIARPDLDVTFLDSIDKKLNFIRDTLENTGLSGTVIHSRAEVLGNDPDFREKYDFAFTRAVAPLNVLAEYCLPFVKIGGRYISMKGSDSEVNLGKNAVAELGGEIEDVVSFKLCNGNSRNLIIIKKVSQTSPKYPRKSKKISSAPL